MDSKAFLPVLLVCHLFFFCYNGVEGYRTLSEEEDLELEEQLKRLNKPALKTIRTKYGDIYDCVDFYKQPAFDHPLLKNHNFHPEMRPASVPKSLSSKKNVPNPNDKSVLMGLEDGGCPVGTVPIRRTTKDDLIRAKLYPEMFASKIKPHGQPGTHFAVAQTLAKIDYDGVGGVLNVYNLPVQAPQYTSGRIKIINGDESLEAGWTVNPALYGDNLTRMYIYTNAGQSHCFNTQCGYVQVSADLPVDLVLKPLSTYGGEQYTQTFSIYQDVINLNWFLKLRDNRTDIGFWPHQIFTNLGNTATDAEWGGEVFSPPGVPGPGMGSGHRLKFDTRYDAYCERTNIVINNTIMEPGEFSITWYTDNKYFFDVRDPGHVRDDIGFLILYGGKPGVTEA